MTVVILARTLEDMSIVADTRVSYGDKKYDPDSGIFKLIHLNVGNPPGIVVFGFSGYLDPICKVLTDVIDEKIRNYKRRFVLSSFGEEVRTWIQKSYETLSRQQQEEFKQLSSTQFMKTSV